MRKLIVIAGCLCVCVAVVLAKPQTRYIDIDLAANAFAGTNTSNDIKGEIKEVTVSCDDGASTGVVAVTYSPQDDSMDDVDIATGTVTDEKLWRPTTDFTDVAGSALTGDPPGQFYIVNETINFEVTASEASNVTWRCRIKYDDGK